MRSLLLSADRFLCSPELFSFFSSMSLACLADLLVIDRHRPVNCRTRLPPSSTHITSIRKKKKKVIDTVETSQSEVALQWTRARL